MEMHKNNYSICTRSIPNRLQPITGQAPCWLSTISYPARSWNNGQITGAQTEVNRLVAEQLLAITYECLAYFKYYYFVAQLVNSGQSCKRNVRNTASSRKSSDKTLHQDMRSNDSLAGCHVVIWYLFDVSQSFCLYLYYLQRNSGISHFSIALCTKHSD